MNKAKATLISISVLLMAGLSGCGSSCPSPIPGPKDITCYSLHVGTGTPIDESQKLELYAPVGNNFTTILIPTDGERLGFALLVQDESGWHNNDKDQLVVRQASSKDSLILDLSPNLRITKGQRRILIVRVPINSFSGMVVHPVVSPGHNVAGHVQQYPTQITSGGINSPFQILDRPLSLGQPLDEQVSNLLDKTQPGDLMIPDRLADDISVDQIKGADLNLCPISQE